jgi:DNA-binding NarL/FixJ family response regulator
VTLRLLIADDHLIVRRGLRSVLADAGDLEIVAEAADGPETIAAYKKHRPDVVLMDLRMPGPEGADVIAALRAEDPAARVLVLTVQKGDEAIYRALKAGASGYLLKDVPCREILEAVRTVAAGGSHIPPAVAQRLAERVGQPELTPRETEVVRFITQGLTNAQIAQRLGITEKATQAHVTAVLAKMGARDRTHASRLALERGLVDVQDLKGE